MKKRIIAAVMCVIMLVSFTSCGVATEAGGMLDRIISSYTTIAYSENYSINIAMLVYYRSLITTTTLNKVTDTFGGSEGMIVYDKSFSYVQENDNGNEALKNGVTVYSKDIAVSKDITSSDSYYYISGTDDGVISYKLETSDGILEGYRLDGNVGSYATGVVVDMAREVLLYCEIANEYGVELTDEEKDEIDESVEEYFKDTDYINSIALFPSVPVLNSLARELLFNEYDVRMAAEYLVLAQKGKEVMTERIEDSIYRSEVEERYNTSIHYADDEETVRNLSYAFFKDEAEAQRAIERVLDRGTVNHDSFRRVVEELHASEAGYEIEYQRGYVKSDAFDEWVYAEDRDEGDFTATPIYDEELSGYYAIFYGGEGEAIWYVRVREELVSERTGEFKDSAWSRYSVTVNYELVSTLNNILVA